jgi:hypothetical protein
MNLTESIPLPVSGRVGQLAPRAAPAARAVPRWSRPSINLAPLRYPRAIGPDRPIRQVELCEVDYPLGRCFHASATLAPELGPTLTNEVYSRAHGGGVHASPLIARAKAVSEALERWAYFSVKGATPKLGGFDVDPSTNGMAAYPGLFVRQARSRARREAVERFALLSWWEGVGAARLLPQAAADESAWQLGDPIDGFVAVLVRRDDAESGLCYYGHAAGRTPEEALGRARIEMYGHEKAVRLFVDANPDPLTALTRLKQTSERRAMYFALAEGQACFRERLKASSWKPRRDPKPVLDKALLGPWSEFADVWRVVYEPPSGEFLSRRNDVFFW